MSPLLGIYTVEIWKQMEASYPGERDIVKRLKGEGASDDACPPPLTGGQRPSHLKTTFLEEALINIAVDTPPRPH